ncbi:MAG: glucuronate isomerase [Candidatus Limnocylindrales bacterium]
MPAPPPLPAPDRLFAPDPAQRRVARELYVSVAGLPIVSPHGHVDPWLLADETATFGTPTDLFIIPDHYVFRMLHSSGVPLEALGVPRRDGTPSAADHREIWQLFADRFHLFRGTPTGIWLAQELQEVFGVPEPLTGANAQAVYDEISDRLTRPEFRPRALFERFNIQTLCTTDDAADPLAAHRALRASGWPGDVRPTFRPDALLDVAAPDWPQRLEMVGQACGREISSCAGLVTALEERRAYFRSMGATATDHGVESAYAAPLEPLEAETIFARALRGQASADDGHRFTGHLLFEEARLSVEDGLVMQLHVGALRNHDRPLFARFGPDKGADIPVACEFTRNLRPLLERFGNDPRFTLVLFTLDESAYARELAPLAGYYPAVRLGSPWWFHDSPNGMARYFDQVMETAGLANTVGFTDDTRAFLSIPARHDVWRRVSANWLAGLVVRGIVDAEAAAEMAADMAVGLARRAYRLEPAPGS